MLRSGLARVYLVHEQEPADWPGDDAARNGAPLDQRVGGTDPRLIAAERIIGQLRTLLGAAVAHAGGTVTVTAEELHDPRVRQIEIRASNGTVHLTLPESGSGAETADPAPSEHPDPPAREPAPRGAFTQRLRRLAEDHPAGSRREENAGGELP